VQVTKPGAEDRNRIGIIGAGAIGSAIARALARVGIGADISNSRGSASLASLVQEIGPTARAVEPAEAARAEMFSYWEVHTYLGSASSDRIALANKIAGRQPTKFSTWARLNVPVQTP
jgi:3-hydroxyacyl-CoA dehydrogenase